MYPCSHLHLFCDYFWDKNDVGTGIHIIHYNQGKFHLLQQHIEVMQTAVQAVMEGQRDELK